MKLFLFASKSFMDGDSTTNLNWLQLLFSKVVNYLLQAYF